MWLLTAAARLDRLRTAEDEDDSSEEDEEEAPAKKDKQGAKGQQQQQQQKQDQKQQQPQQKAQVKGRAAGSSCMHARHSTPCLRVGALECGALCLRMTHMAHNSHTPGAPR